MDHSHGSTQSGEGVSIAIVGRYPLLNGYVRNLLRARPDTGEVRAYGGFGPLCGEDGPSLDILVTFLDRHRDLDTQGFGRAVADLAVKQSIVLAEEGVWMPEQALRNSILVSMSLSQLQLDRLLSGTVTACATGVVQETLCAHYPDPPASVFTGKERQVLRFLKSGISNKQIAARMNVSESTIKSHVGRIYAKSGLRNRISLSLMANRVIR